VPAEDGAERTRNGLLKRPMRSQVAQGAPPPAAPAGAAGHHPAPVDESPEQVRNRLVSLRAGFQRSESERGRDEQ
jgi:hypothetical protein